MKLEFCPFKILYVCHVQAHGGVIYMEHLFQINLNCKSPFCYVCASVMLCEFGPVCDNCPLLLLTMILPFTPALPSPCMMQPIWRCTTSASPLCPSWLTASWSSTSLWTISWIIQPSIGTFRTYSKILSYRSLKCTTLIVCIGFMCNFFEIKMLHSSIVTYKQK